ncbi:MAG: hypothetical protein JSV49_11865 [Thermoplasmata archaeon]|nr:MAG: hypothetical protein JSV49_11865 [Thermoplasmata archaeon]
MGILQLISFFIWMLILIALSFLTDYILARLANPTAHRIFVGPGIIVHEYSHALACVLTRTKIHEIKLFEKTGGHVTHEKRNPVIMTFISMAPLFGGILVIILLTALFGSFGVSFHSGFIDLEPSGFPQAFLALLASAGYTIYNNIILLNMVTIFFFIFLYFVGTITAVLAPSSTDLKHAVLGMIIIFVLAVVTITTKPLSYIPGVTDYFQSSTPALDFIITWLSRGIAIGLIAVFIFLVPLLIMLAVKSR